MSSAKVGIVGPCAAGKTSLAEVLSEHGLIAKQIVQEHSYAPQMWRIIGKPDFLIYLHASYESCSQRKSLNWSRSEYEQQLERLADARAYCDLYLATDDLTEAQVAERAMAELDRRGMLEARGSG